MVTGPTSKEFKTVYNICIYFIIVEMMIEPTINLLKFKTVSVHDVPPPEKKSSSKRFFKYRNLENCKVGPIYNPNKWP